MLGRILECFLYSRVSIYMLYRGFFILDFKNIEGYFFFDDLCSCVGFSIGVLGWEVCGNEWLGSVIF